MTNTSHPIEVAIRTGAAQMAVDLAPDSSAKLVQLLQLLEKWSKSYNLTAIRNIDEMVAGHVLDSLVAKPFLHGERVIDIGTGAGFPGLPLALIEPHRHFTLLDSNGKKLRFVHHAAGELGLGNIDIVHSRAEQYRPEQAYDTVLCRAFASLGKIVGFGAHLVADSGRIVALKAGLGEAELAEVPADWSAEVTPLDVPGINSPRCAATLSR